MSLWVSAFAGITPRQQVDLQTARQLIIAGECDAALKKLDLIAAQNPNESQVLLLLKDAYICTQQYDKAQQILDDLIKSATQPAIKAEYVVANAELQLKQSNKPAGDSIMQRAIAIAPQDSRVYQYVAQAYMTSGYYNDAVTTYLTGRKNLKDDYWFARELGRLYEIMRSYGDAAREYFRAVEGDTTQAAYVVGRMNSMISEHASEDYDTGLDAELQELAKKHPTNKYAHKFYADFLLSAGRYQDALRQYILTDSLGYANGAELVHFCSMAGEAGDAEAVLQARNELKRRYPDSPHLTNAGFILGNALTEAGRYDEAINLYQELADSAVNVPEKTQAMLMLGYTLYQGRHDPKAALAVFASLVADYGRIPNSQIARLYAAECHLSLGQPEIADSLYQQISVGAIPQNFQEELLFRKGELNFYIGDYNEARNRYGELMNSFPKSIYVNDCLRRMMLISEHPDMAQLELQLYSQALYATARFDYDSALVAYRKLQHRDDSTLAQLAWFSAAEVIEEQGRHTEALAEFDSLLALYPQGFYAPLALEKQGDICASGLDDYARAQAIYEKMLLDYPKALNQEEVRKKLVRVKQLGDQQRESSKS